LLVYDEGRINNRMVLLLGGTIVMITKNLVNTKINI